MMRCYISIGVIRTGIPGGPGSPFKPGAPSRPGGPWNNQSQSFSFWNAQQKAAVLFIILKEVSIHRGINLWFRTRKAPKPHQLHLFVLFFIWQIFSWICGLSVFEKSFVLFLFFGFFYYFFLFCFVPVSLVVHHVLVLPATTRGSRQQRRWKQKKERRSEEMGEKWSALHPGVVFRACAVRFST